VLFSPSTLARHLADHDLVPETWTYYWTSSPGGFLRWCYDLAARLAMRCRPAYGDGLLVTVRASTSR
jgi:hypothetical protein